MDRCAWSAGSECLQQLWLAKRSELFQKGAILYGLDRARAPITKEDRAIVVEGNTDVLALRQAGLSVPLYEHASGVSGTWYWNRYPGCAFDTPSGTRTSFRTEFAFANGGVL